MSDSGKNGRGSWDLSGLLAHCIDDYQPMHRILRASLDAIGIHRQEYFLNPLDCVEAMKRRMPDVIITEYRTEPFDGLELTRMIRMGRAGKNRFVPIILLTGHATTKVVRQARDAGMSSVMAKPVPIEFFYRRLSRIVLERASFVETKTYFGPDRRRQDREFAGPERRRGAAPAQQVA